MRILGEGEEESALRDQAERLGIEDVVHFVGAVPYEEALAWFEWADCLVLPSVHNEGWPKVIAEAMCFGLVCVAVAHGQLSEMLSGRGVLLETGSYSEIAGALQDIADSPQEYSRLAREASNWSSRFTLEGLREALRELMEQQWGVELERE